MHLVGRLARAFRNWRLAGREPMVPADVLGMPGATEFVATGLSEQERVVLAELCTGKSRKMIADDLGIADATVARYLERTYRKIGAHNVIEAVNWAYSHGVVPPPALVERQPEIPAPASIEPQGSAES
jgi:DNA-binding NarL/FixJ family response regulator